MAEKIERRFFDENWEPADPAEAHIMSVLTTDDQTGRLLKSQTFIADDKPAPAAKSAAQLRVERAQAALAQAEKALAEAEQDLPTANGEVDDTIDDFETAALQSMAAAELADDDFETDEDYEEDDDDEDYDNDGSDEASEDDEDLEWEEEA